MKKAVLQIVLIMLFAPFILAQTTNRYFDEFNSGNAEGWTFFADASVSVQNGQLRLQSFSPDFQIAHIYPPIMATVNDFSMEYSAVSNSEADGGFVGRLGFNSLLGMLFEDDTMRVVYATDITNFYEPAFVTLYTQKVNDYTTKGKITVVKSGANLQVSCFLNDTLKYTGTIQNAPQGLLKGHLMLSVVGEAIDFKLSMIDINYVPYIDNVSNSLAESFNDPLTPWFKSGTWDKVGTGVSISAGNLNFNHTDSSFVSLYAGVPVGPVENYEMTTNWTGTNPSGTFGVWRAYSNRYYTGMMYDGDSLKICYQNGGNAEPIMLSGVAVDLNQYSSVRLKCERNGTAVTMTGYGNSTQLVTATLNTSDTRLYSGHLLLGWDTDDPLSVSITSVTVAFNRFVTGVDETSGPTGFTLSQNYPNPFNPSTRIRFTLEKAGLTSLVVYDALGRECAILVDGEMESGEHEVVFDASRFSGGVYFYRLNSGGYTTTGKMVLLK